MFPLQSSVPRRGFPVVTWTIIALNVLVFAMYSGLDPKRIEAIFHHLGVVPARYTHPEWGLRTGLSPSDYSPFLWSMFLHGGLAHLVGNMWTLWIFGPNVEDRMGPARFGIFYLLTGLAAGLVHLYTNPDSIVPTVGASGAIAGVMGGYLTLFPRARIVFMVPIFFYPVFFVWPAALYLVYWFGIQLFSGTLSLVSPEQVGGVAWWAHVGGFGAGILTCRMFALPRRRRPAIPDYAYHLYRGE